MTILTLNCFTPGNSMMLNLPSKILYKAHTSTLSHYYILSVVSIGLRELNDSGASMTAGKQNPKKIWRGNVESPVQLEILPHPGGIYFSRTCFPAKTLVVDGSGGWSISLISHLFRFLLFLCKRLTTYLRNFVDSYEVWLIFNGLLF